MVLFGQAGIGTLLTGEIVGLPDRADGLISAAMFTSLAIALVVGALVSVVVVFVPGFKLSGLDILLLFVGIGLTELFFMSDQIFVGLLQANFRMMRQFLFSILKLVFIIVAAVWLSNEMAIMVSWVIALLVTLIFGESLMWYYGQSSFHRPDFRLLYKLRRRSAHHYMLDMGIQVPTAIMPYLVAVLLSPTSNAVFTVIWMIVSVASIVPGAMATVLFPVIRAEPEQYRSKMMLSLCGSLLFAVGFGLFIFIYSTEILSLFNPVYAKIGDEYFQYLGFGMIGSVVKFHVCAAARINNYMRQAAWWFYYAAFFEFFCVIVGCQLDGLEGLSIWWSVAMLIEGAVMLIVVNPCGVMSHRVQTRIRLDTGTFAENNPVTKINQL